VPASNGDVAEIAFGDFGARFPQTWVSFTADHLSREATRCGIQDCAPARLNADFVEQPIRRQLELLGLSERTIKLGAGAS
jgi:hypothetical protein